LLRRRARPSASAPRAPANFVGLKQNNPRPSAAFLPNIKNGIKRQQFCACLRQRAHMAIARATPFVMDGYEAS
jgi:hypothetical protein